MTEATVSPVEATITTDATSSRRNSISMLTKLLRSRRLLAAALIVGSATLVPSPQAGAKDHPVVKLKPGDVITLGYPAIDVPNTTNEASDPETCRTDPLGQQYCDAIRVEVEKPPNGLGYFIQVQMAWETRVDQKGVPNFEQLTDNDMDLWAYNIPYDKEKTSTENEHASGGATTKQPEVLYITPDPVVDLVVVNYIGVNTGYTLKFTYVVDEVFTPFESLDPTFQPAVVTPPVAEPVAVAPVAAPAPPAPQVVDANPSLSMVGVDDPFGLEAPLKDGRPALNLIRQPTQAAANTRDAPPESTAMVLLWLAVVPGGILGAVAVALYRRRQGFSVR